MNEPATPVPEAPKRRVTANKVMAGVAVVGIALLIAGGVTGVAGISIAGFLMLMVSASWFFVI
jgi:hypothetical protein